MANTCGTCARGYRRDNGNISCGAAVDDAALRAGEAGMNPIWAERKYHRVRLFLMLAGKPTNDEGIDCENMRPDDGARCRVWQSRTYRS